MKTGCLVVMLALIGVTNIANAQYYGDRIFLGTFDVIPAGPTGSQDQRFAIQWISNGALAVAAIRGDASIRNTSDPKFVVTHVATGHYCVQVSNPAEGTVGVLQNDGGAPGLIDVTMGIGNPCPTTPSAQISVRTWGLP